MNLDKKTVKLRTVWRDMQQRCYNARRPEYKDCGGKGLTVCPEWRHNFDAFEGWALENGFDEDCTIERIDNDAGYCPENCRVELRA